MDKANYKPQSETQAPDCAAASASPRTPPALRLIATGLRLAEPVTPPDPAWAQAFARLLGWLDVGVDAVAAARGHGLRKVTGWARGAAAEQPAPLFAPWQVISPVAFQAGGGAELPQADWAASYLFDHGQGTAAASAAPTDLVLMSPHPARCAVEEAGDGPMPRLAVLEAMIRAARDEGRTRLALIVPARQRNAFARHLLRADRALTREGLELEILPVEQAVPALMAPRPRWDALIVMPEWRSIVFALLAGAGGATAPWPMLWHQPGGTVLVASEALCEAGARLPLDAVVLVQALALTLRQAGMGAAALRLHESCARLRESGTVTPARGSPAPYVTEVDDARFVELVCTGAATSGRTMPRWRALGDPALPGTAREDTRLYIIASNPPPSSS